MRKHEIASMILSGVILFLIGMWMYTSFSGMKEKEICQEALLSSQTVVEGASKMQSEIASFLSEGAAYESRWGIQQAMTDFLDTRNDLDIGLIDECLSK